MSGATPSPSISFHDFEQAGWQRAATSYHDGFGPITSQVVQPLLDAARVGKGTRLLDVASGPGYGSAGAAVRGAIVIGMDFSGEMVALARRLHPDIEFREGDAQAMPFEAEHFDAVTMCFLVGHLSAPERALEEGARVLRRGGRLAFTWWQTPDKAVGFGIIREALQRHGRTDVGLPEGPPFEQYSDPAVCRERLVAAGFGDITVEPVVLTWRAASPEDMFDTYFRASVRTGGVLRAQTPEELAAIRAAVIERVREFDRGGRIEIPMPCHVAAGTRG
jgi:ubiquinone/menaquinone biosynthesis C-methylase UbiE